ncbi:endonuclease/exonuclease/phosphatase family protein [Candidatus Neomarinimicrobiota bacterium]
MVPSQPIQGNQIIAPRTTMPWLTTSGLGSLGRSTSLAALSLAVALLLAGCEPLITTFEDIEEADYYRAASLAQAPEAPDTLKVVTWNIKFGGGGIDFWFDCWGDRVIMSESEVAGNMERLVAKIRDLNPDILLIQEVDVDSKRSNYMDQLQYILDHTDLNYAAYASHWKVQYVPSDGIGRVNNGNAILSRWPVADAERIALDLRTDQSALVRLFYVRRNILKARVSIPGYDDSLYIVNIHAAAFSHDGTKLLHINRFITELDALDSQGSVFIAGGDLNSIPPDTSSKQSDFSDSICEDEMWQADDYMEEVRDGWLVSLYQDYHTAIPFENFISDNAAYYTHTTQSDGPFNRKIDYLFANTEWVQGSGIVYNQDMGSGVTRLSDHVPISARIVLP